MKRDDFIFSLSKYMAVIPKDMALRTRAAEGEQRSHKFLLFLWCFWAKHFT